VKQGGQPPPYQGARARRPHRSALGRRFSVALIALVVLAGAIVGILAVERGNRPGTATARRLSHLAPKTALTRTTKPVPPPGVDARLMAWRLPVAVTRAVVLAGPGTSLVVAGGLTRSGASGNGAFLLSTHSGAVHLVAVLPAAVHDASGAVLTGRDVIFGGYGTAPTPMVQAFPAPAGALASAASVTTATADPALPQPRVGSSTVTVGTTCYVVGGSDGASAEREVLATTDGRTFRPVAALALAVEYPAVAARGGYIFVFGGRTWGGHPVAKTPLPRTGVARAHATRAWAAVDDIQRIDLRTGRTTIVGHLAAALQGASAATLDDNIYLAGGRTTSTVQGTIWAYEPATATMVVAGHLSLPVSDSGLAVVGATAWLVGGESGDGPVASVQSFRPLPTRAFPAQPGEPSATTGARSTPLAGATS
jgi:hypothetical protein